MLNVYTTYLLYTKVQNLSIIFNIFNIPTYIILMYTFHLLFAYIVVIVQCMGCMGSQMHIVIYAHWSDAVNSLFLLIKNQTFLIFYSTIK